ncbi:TolC family protein [Burkholderia cepacia]|uniref:TolC family protein n=1 Tax=Burkholderia cepacia TaxID=292 RepID=UPI002AB6CBFA|nr:TolC family protein [Burkholderia cepacia]
MSAARRFRAAVVTAVSALAAGCSLLHPIGPDYRSPAQTDAMLGGASGAPFSPEAPPGPWWRLYRDPALDRYIDEALRENRDLRAAASRLQIAQAQLDQAEAAWLPTTSVTARAARARDSVPGVPGLHVSNTLSAALGVSYELDLFGRIRRSTEAATASVDAQQFAFAATQIRIAASTASAYAGACQSNAALAVARRTVQVDADTLETTQRLANGGSASQVDVIRARAQLASDRARLPVLDAQRTASLYALATLLGRQPDRYPREAAQCAAPPTLAQPMPVGDGLALLRRRPDIAQAERTLASATAGIGVAAAGLYPQISIGLSVGAIGTTPANALRANGRTWSVGPLMQWTFPNRAIADALLRQAGANADLAKTNYDATVLNALKETDSALDAYARELDHHDQLQQARDDNRAALAQVQRLYGRGATPYLDVLVAQKSLAEAEQQLVDSAGAIASDQIAVFAALGGGWDDAAQRAAEQAAAAAASRRDGAPAARP